MPDDTARPRTETRDRVDEWAASPVTRPDGPRALARGTDPEAPRQRRPSISPDNHAEHRAVIVSSAMLRELAREWFRRGIACTGARFNGETPNLQAPAIQTILDVEFAKQYRDRNK